MRVSGCSAMGLVLFSALTGTVSRGQASKAKATSACKVGRIEGTLDAGRPFEHPIGNGLKIWFQPIASGWILRIIPAAGEAGKHDYAELATPPYQSVSPLSVSTDFSFRAQDAIGWNPRRFRFATSAAEFKQLDQVYERYEKTAGSPAPGLEEELSSEIQKTAEGKLTVVDARLVPGSADQWKMASSVSNHFQATAHTLQTPARGKSTPLGSLVCVRFQVALALPGRWQTVPGMQIVSQDCGRL